MLARPFYAGQRTQEAKKQYSFKGTTQACARFSMRQTRMGCFFAILKSPDTLTSTWSDTSAITWRLSVGLRRRLGPAMRAGTD
jgi:hypothetical protein